MWVLFACINLKGSRIKVSGRIRERCHPSHRFFTPCHVAASRLSHKAFLFPFRMTVAWKSSLWGGTLIVILNECEVSIPVVRKAVRCHSEQERRRLSDYLLLHKVFIANRFYKRNSAGKNRVWVSLFYSKERKWTLFKRAKRHYKSVWNAIPGRKER